MKKFSIIQMIILVVAGVAIVVAVLMFSLYRGGGSGKGLSSVEIWGVVPSENFQRLFNTGVNDLDEQFFHVSYLEINKSDFESEFLTALAEGRGPDLVLISGDQLVENKNRLTPIPYSSFDKRNFRDLFIEGGDLLELYEGYAGIPIMVDPLVMYYNKDILNSAGIPRPPSTWTEISALTSQLTESNSSFDVSKTTIPLGTFNNIKNAKEIIWALIMQAGNDVVVKDYSDSVTDFQSILAERLNYSLPPAEAAINFYTQFSNPSRTIYSWNNSLPNSDEMFLAGDSAFYLGFASELPILKTKNPNLNFDVAEIPQSQNSSKKTTFGEMYFLALPRGASDIGSSFNTASLFAQKENQERLSNITGLPSVRRDVLAEQDSTNSFSPVFNKSALYSRFVLEPDSDSSNNVLRSMIQSITSGQFDVSSAIKRANEVFENELGK